MNKKGSLAILSIMLAITIIVLVLALAGPVKESAFLARNESHGNIVGMNCSTTTDNFVKAGCLVVDLNLFYFVGALLLIAGGVMGARVLLS